MNDNYSAENIDVLEGLEAVRKRPGMYIGSTGKRGLHHLVWEIVDNSIDEALAGYADAISVIVHEDNSITITDNGRGIPIDTHSQTGLSALETIMTVLHAGGKFGGGGYKVSGGLHGVGASVVNALSSYLEVKVYRNGKIYKQTYSRGKATSKVEIVGESTENGTYITFKPDEEIFTETLVYDYDILNLRLHELSFLNRGIKINFIDERGENLNKTFYHENGIVEYVEYLNKNSTVIHEKIFKVQNELDDIVVEVSLQYNSGYETGIFSYVNNIKTHEGGTHEEGFKTALTRAINIYAKKKNLLKDESLLGEDVREGLNTVISIKHMNPQFEGQTKTKLGNSDARTAVTTTFFTKFEQFLMENPKEAHEIIEKCLTSARARVAAKKARELTRKKTTFESTSLPGKLADCSSKNPDICEIYIVEGDSAGGSAKQGRERTYQAILPLRGKVINVEKASQDKVFANNEILAMGAALGVGLGKDFNIEKLRYNKVIIMTDADVDGAHIRTLLLTFFYNFMRPLIENGHIYIAQPPLYKISFGKKIEYAYTDEEKDIIIERDFSDKKFIIQRYKGLGEMNPEQLWETTMDPEVRFLLRITMEDAMLADTVFKTLMGDETEPRKVFIQQNARYATVDI
jgi:DNA gyrase subunit B